MHSKYCRHMLYLNITVNMGFRLKPNGTCVQTAVNGSIQFKSSHNGKIQKIQKSFHIFYILTNTIHTISISTQLCCSTISLFCKYQSFQDEIVSCNQIISLEQFNEEKPVTDNLIQQNSSSTKLMIIAQAANTNTMG